MFIYYISKSIFHIRNDENNLKGYPMSIHVSSIDSNKLSFNSLEVACHSVEKHCEKLKNGNYMDLIVSLSFFIQVKVFIIIVL